MKLKNSIKEDAELIKRIASGDASAENRLCQKYREKILFVAKRKVDNYEDAEDICQDTLIDMLNAARKGDIKNPEKLSAFVYAICRNKVNDWLKYKYQISTVPIDETDGVQDDNNAFKKIITEERNKKIAAAFHQLDIRERRILYLKYVREWSGKEIGHRLGLKPGTVRKTAERARKKLAEKLSQISLFSDLINSSS